MIVLCARTLEPGYPIIVPIVEIECDILRLSKVDTIFSVKNYNDSDWLKACSSSVAPVQKA